MKIIITIGYHPFIFDITERDRAMEFALTAAIKSDTERIVQVEILKENKDEEESDNEE